MKLCSTSEVNHIVLTAQDLATSYSNYQNKVDLMSPYNSSRGINCLEKVSTAQSGIIKFVA